MHGSDPAVANQASAAETAIQSGDLSSEAPRATMRPSVIAGFERGRVPELDRVGRLDVVMAVDEQRGRAGGAGGAEPGGVDGLVAAAVEQLDVAHADALEPGAQDLGGLGDAGGVGRVGGDAGGADEIQQLVEQAGAVVGEPGVDGHGVSVVTIERRAGVGIS